MRILISRTDRIGDVMLSTPAVRALRKAYPASHIAFMLEKGTEKLLSGNPHINEIIIADKKGAHKGLMGLLALAALIRRGRFDMAVILHPSERAHAACFLAMVPKRIGFDRKWPALLTRKVRHEKQNGQKHEAEYTLDLAMAAGAEYDGLGLELYTGKEASEKAAALLSNYGVKKTDRVVAFHPGASCPSKRWPPDRFAKAADELKDKYGIVPVIVGDAGSREFARKMAEAGRYSYIDLTGKTDLDVLAEVLKKSALFISNDTGPVHMATAVGTPVISIFGRNDPGLSPKRWGPLGKKDRYIHKDAGCEVCLAHNCRIGFKCLDAISVADVNRAAEDILGK